MPQRTRRWRTSQPILQRARELRREMTPAEQRLWHALRTTLAHLRVRRQHPIGSYILDFYHAPTRSAFEIDGDVHALPEQMEHDRLRGEWLAEQGIRVVRFTNEDVLKRLGGVLESIREACEGEHVAEW